MSSTEGFRKIAFAILVTHDLRDGAAHALHLHPRDPLHSLRHGLHGDVSVAVPRSPRSVALDCV